MDGGAAVRGKFQRKRVVIVGGGVAGGLLAKTLQFDADVVLIDPKEYFEIPWANLRAKMDLSVAEKMIFNHTDYLVNGKLITSSAIDITEQGVVTAEGRVIAYEILVIATGHKRPYPRTRRSRLEQFQEDNLKIKTSSSVLIIGGGPTGVELAAEIAVDHPDKKVTLVHSGKRLLQFIGPKASQQSLDWFKSKGVEVLLEQSVDIGSISEADKVFTTSAGATITADCYFICVDKPLASSWLQESIITGSVDENGSIMVDEHLRVKGHTNIFAIGDTTDVPELKQGYMAQRHALVVAKNVKQILNGAKESKLRKYKPASPLAMVTLGRKNCVAQFPFITMMGYIPGLIKSKDLFVHKTRRQMGLDCNSRSLELF